MVDNINKNTISEKLARKNLNALNKLKDAEIKHKCLSSNQTELLKLSDYLLETIGNNNNNNNNNSNNNGNNNENESDSEHENDNDNVNDNGSESESEDKNEEYYKIKQLNGYFKMIDETKSFEKQINLFKKMNILEEYWHTRYYDDNKELNLKIFKAKFAYISNYIDDKLFEEVFGHTFVILADKLVNTTNKEENQIIINDLKKMKINFTSKMIFIIL